jgi:hypothetical protein
MYNLMKMFWPAILIGNMCTYEFDLVVVPSSSSLPKNTPNSSLDTNNDDEDPPLPISPPATTPSTNSYLLRWVYSTHEATGDLAGDPTDQRRTRS